MIPRERIIDTARRVFRSYGFSPIDTPALEYLEILLGKGGARDRQAAVPLPGPRRPRRRACGSTSPCRWPASPPSTSASWALPFKRYHIATVWRGENTQRGRYREFMQCDFDTIGTKSVAADVEIVLVVHDLLRAIGFERFTIRVNNRAGAQRAARIARPAEPRRADVLRALDKLGEDRRASAWPRRFASTAGATADASRAGRSTMVQLDGDNDADPRAACGRSSPATPRGERGRRAPAPSCCRPLAAAGVPAERVAARCLDRPRPRLLHRHRARNDARRPAHDRQRLQRRPLRQPGRAVHEASSCPASARRSASTDCSPRWKSSA